MRDKAAANLLRMGRVRLDLRQADVGDRSGLSRASIASHELGAIEGATVRALREHAEAIGLTLEITLRGQTGEIVKDEEHALVTQWVKRQLDPMGWTTDAEASFSIYGERGRIDLLGWHAGRRIVLIDEQKTDLTDVQDVLGTLDVKERLARRIAADRGWDVESVAVLLVITRTARNLRTVKRFEVLFSRYNLRGAEAARWLRDPHGSARLLLFVPPSAVGRATWRNGRQRVRRPPGSPRSTTNVTPSDTRQQPPPSTDPNATPSDTRRPSLPSSTPNVTASDITPPQPP